MRVLRFVGVLLAALDSVSCRMAVSATGSSPLERRLLSEGPNQKTNRLQYKNIKNWKQHSSHCSVYVQRFGGLFGVNCSTAGFWTPLHAQRVHDQVLFSSIMLHRSLVLILLCICYVKGFGLRTHCWRWGCLWHLTAQRAYSRSLPLWTASTEEIHLRHRKHFVTAGLSSLIFSLSLFGPVSTSTYHWIITIFAALHFHEVFLFIDRCSWESSKFTFYSIITADKPKPTLQYPQTEFYRLIHNKTTADLCPRCHQNPGIHRILTAMVYGRPPGTSCPAELFPILYFST